METEKANGQYDFYPRSPCGERLQHTDGLTRDVLISIHALLAESDLLPLLKLV